MGVWRAFFELVEPTEAFLLDARSNFSETAEGICSDEVHEFEQFLQQNELELSS